MKASDGQDQYDVHQEIISPAQVCYSIYFNTGTKVLSNGQFQGSFKTATLNYFLLMLKRNQIC